MDGEHLLSLNDRLWAANLGLQEQLRGLRAELARRQDVSRRLELAEHKIASLTSQNATLRKQLREITEKLKSTSPSTLTVPPKPLPPFIKPNKPLGPKRKPGQKSGHTPAHRPTPQAADEHHHVPLGLDRFGAPCCTQCHTQLNDVKEHQRFVEDIVPARAVVTCYHTTSGWCPSCRKHIESRAVGQPPAPPGVDLPQGQMGLKALVMAAVMRICYRMPLRQITRLFHQLPGLKLSPGGVSRQLQRLSKWLENQYHRLKLALRVSNVVYADETSWRTDGRNAQLWTLTTPRHTLYHVDPSRSGKVLASLLGKNFNANGQSTLVSDFYAAYDQFTGPQQKCIAHLLREFKQTAEGKPELENHPFFTRSRRLIRAMLSLRTRRADMDQPLYNAQVQRLEQRLEHLGRPLPPPPSPPSPPSPPDPANNIEDQDVTRLRKRLAKYRTKLTTFLHNPEVDPTNNAAERAIRPAVVMRKITGGSRSTDGAHTYSVLASVIRTAEQQGRDVIATLEALITAEWQGQTSDLLK
jgi:transposase